MWTWLIIWVIAVIIILLFFAGANKKPDNWDGLHREGEDK
jgi:hypothetical protein